MIEKQVEVKLKSGLQARQAALFVQEANRYKADVFLEKAAKAIKFMITKSCPNTYLTPRISRNREATMIYL